MPRPGFVSVTLPKELSEVLRQLAASLERVDDDRRRDTAALAVRFLLEHYSTCVGIPRSTVPPPGVPPLDAFAAAEARA